MSSIVHRTAPIRAVNETRFPDSLLSTFPTVVEFRGAELNVLAVNTHWEQSQIPELRDRPLSTRSIPNTQVARESLFAPDDAIRALREWCQYACHDLRVVSRKPDGSLLYLATRRLEPKYLSNLSADRSVINDGRVAHSAPINGCWWPPGGRIAVPKPGSALERQGFDVIDSLLLKLNNEIGLNPNDVCKIRFLGVGETFFEREMEYTYRCTDRVGTVSQFKVPVSMPAPQRTINKNYVVEINPEAILRMEHLCSACWIDAASYRRHREQFCSYEQRFVDALFGERT